jgi:hypothetical protein
VHIVESEVWELCSPVQALSADESVIKFKGRVGFRICNPQKPTRWGLHIPVIADSTNGYGFGLNCYVSITAKSLMPPEEALTSILF